MLVARVQGAGWLSVWRGHGACVLSPPILGMGNTLVLSDWSLDVCGCGWGGTGFAGCGGCVACAVVWLVWRVWLEFPWLLRVWRWVLMCVRGVCGWVCGVALQYPYVPFETQVLSYRVEMGTCVGVVFLVGPVCLAGCPWATVSWRPLSVGTVDGLFTGWCGLGGCIGVALNWSNMGQNGPAESWLGCGVG